MTIEIVARGFELPDVARTAIETQIRHLEKIGLGFVEATLTLEFRRNQFHALISFFGRRVSFHAETQVEADSVTAAVDDVLDKVERQMRKHKDRFEAKRRIRPEVEAVHEPSSSSKSSFEVVPMPRNFESLSVEEAAQRLHHSGDTFLVFRNRENHDLNVLFKKRDGTFGWIYAED